MSHSAGRSDMGIGTALLFGAAATVAAVLMLTSDTVAPGVGGFSSQQLAAVGFAAAMLFGSLSIVGAHVYLD